MTAVPAAEVDEELVAIVAVGAPGGFRRRFLGLLTGYQTLLGAVLAIPLGLFEVFTFARMVYSQGPCGHVTSSDVFVPVAPIPTGDVIPAPVSGSGFSARGPG